MGSESFISGYLFVPWRIDGWLDEERRLYQLTCAEIQKLPDYTDDIWPFMPREVFHCIETNPAESVAYRGHMIPFALSVKQIARNPGDWTEWLSKFEELLSRSYWTRAFVQLSTPSYHPIPDKKPTIEWAGHHLYHYMWEADGEMLEGLMSDPPSPVRSWQRREI